MKIDRTSAESRLKELSRTTKTISIKLLLEKSIKLNRKMIRKTIQKTSSKIDYKIR